MVVLSRACVATLRPAKAWAGQAPRDRHRVGGTAGGCGRGIAAVPANVRGIKVYGRRGFQQSGRYLNRRSGGESEFNRMEQQP
jgi:hypothetical protein